MSASAPTRGADSSDSGEVFAPSSRRGALWPGVAGTLALALALALLLRAIAEGISFAAFLMIVIAAVLLVGGGIAAYWAWACMTLRYVLDQGVLTIQWGGTRYETPVRTFERAVRGRATMPVPVAGLEWPGCHIGEVTLPRIGRVRVLSLHRSGADVLYLVGPDAGFAISPANPAVFVRALQRQMDVRGALASPRIVTHPMLRALELRDRPLLAALGAAAVLALLATAVVFSRYAGFPDRIVLNFPEETRIAGRAALLGIPLVAWLLLAANGAASLRLARVNRGVAFTLLYGLEFVEALLVIAAITAV